MRQLAHEVASSCGFDYVPPFLLRRGKGGDWNPKLRYVRIGRRELEGDDQHLWYVMAHELAHAQTRQREGHSKQFWNRLANGLVQAGKLELLRFDFGYKEAALGVAEEHGLSNVPKRGEFKLAIGTIVDDVDGRRWKVERRFRRARAPYYRLKARGWVWTTSEMDLLSRGAIDRG